MPLPFIIGGLAAAAAAAGIGAGVKGGIDTKKASDRLDAAKNRNERNLAAFKDGEEETRNRMETLGKTQMTVAKDFERFSNAFEKIKNRPDFSARKFNANIPPFSYKEIHAMSVAAGAFLGAAAGGAAGAVFGTAAAAGTTAAVMALGTASTGTAIASLSGAAATKATLAVLGGGTLAAGGGGVALGTTILGASTLGVGLLVGGAIFAVTGAKIKEKAEEAYSSMLRNEEEIDRTLSYLSRIRDTAYKLDSAITKVHRVYDTNVIRLIQLVERETDWNVYNDDEQLLVENNIFIVAILNKMINTPLLKVTKTNYDGSPAETDLDSATVTQVVDSSLSALNEQGITV
ncbi:MAG: hypothetical protein FWH22_10930 [Fibromonadales bacterium]|nr:hypothetical protein [Fibromonadales bacterium]